MLLKWLDNIIWHNTTLSDTLHNKNIYLHLSLQNACLFALMAQATFLIFFIHVGVWSLCIVNICSILGYLLCYWLVLQNQYTPVGVILTTELAVYATISGLILGNGNYGLLGIFMDISLQLLIPYIATRVRIIISSLLTLLLISLIIMGYTFQPLVDLGKANMVLCILHVLSSIGALLIGALLLPRVQTSVNYWVRHQLEELKTEAYLDPLTQLHNRRYADIVFDQLRHYTTSSLWHVALLDIDDFKFINDDYGHLAGDMVLKALSETVQEQLHAGDFAFRWGGEEFLFLLKNCTSAQAYARLDNIRKVLGQSAVRYEQASIHFTVTIGAGKLDLQDIIGSINNCDQKMYQGKRSGKNKVVF
ncbi:GGDEF domain-containing protein [Ethanoligenens sp.]|uniref:GGDEF domain-containing protein n=1 Tax=Ethanoligenens sp. TaxID=2099655 RepID=UPI0039E87D3E